MAKDEHPSSEAKGGDAGEAKPRDGQQSGKPNGKPRTRRRLIIPIIAGVVVLAGFIGGLLYWLHARHYVTTDDAYIDTTVTNVAPRAGGQVMAVYVRDYQPVTAGQLLAQIDDSPARAQLAQAAAARAQAIAQISQAEAQIQVTGAQLEQARANTAAPEAQARNAERDLQRFLSVQASTPAAVSRQQVDQARTTALANAGQAQAAQKQVKIAAAQQASARTQIAAAEAQKQSAEAQMAQSNLQIAYARIVADVTGRIAHKTLTVGDYVQPGQNVMSIVPQDVWITANFKETQLKHMRPGQTVEIKIDAYPDLKVTGHIDSIQPGAGQAFAVLPPQNATGNFVKVVQRVPVKILIDHPERIHRVLGPGMSVVPHVRID